MELPVANRAPSRTWHPTSSAAPPAFTLQGQARPYKDENFCGGPSLEVPVLATLQGSPLYLQSRVEGESGRECCSRGHSGQFRFCGG